MKTRKSLDKYVKSLETLTEKEMAASYGGGPIFEGIAWAIGHFSATLDNFVEKVGAPPTLGYSKS